MERSLLLKLSVAVSKQESRALLRIVVAFATAHGFVVDTGRNNRAMRGRSACTK